MRTFTKEETENGLKKIMQSEHNMIHFCRVR